MIGIRVQLHYHLEFIYVCLLKHIVKGPVNIYHRDGTGTNCFARNKKILVPWLGLQNKVSIPCPRI